MATFVSKHIGTVINHDDNDSCELIISNPVDRAMGNYFKISNDTVLNDSDSAFLLADVEGASEIRPSHSSSAMNAQNGDNHCHGRLPEDDTMARNQLLMVSIFCFLFMIAEIAGGMIANSLAIATDATHLACDLAGFLISLFAIWIAKKPPSKKLSFGYYRAEVLGALCSVLLIWGVTVVLVMLAIKRIIANDYDVGGIPMIITASLGVFFNIIMGVVLHSGLCKSCSNIKVNFGHGHSHSGHGHSHGGHGHSHGGHGHSHGGSRHDNTNVISNNSDNILINSDSSDEPIVNTQLVIGTEPHHHHQHRPPSHAAATSNHQHNIPPLPPLVNSIDDYYQAPHNHHNHHHRDHHHHSDHHHNHSDDHSHIDHTNGQSTTTTTATAAATAIFQPSSNINVRAAFVHVIGDLIQSIGVFIAAIIIIAKPEYKIADPICTFIFSFLVLCTTMPVLRDVFNILMEGVPMSIDQKALVHALYALKGVKSVHCLNLWSITVDKVAVNVHLAIEDERDWTMILNESRSLLVNQFDVHLPTIQVEMFIPGVMNTCSRCQLP